MKNKFKQTNKQITKNKEQQQQYSNGLLSTPSANPQEKVCVLMQGAFAIAGKKRKKCCVYGVLSLSWFLASSKVSV